MKKVYKKLTEEQRHKNIIFCSTLSMFRTEHNGDTTHNVFKTDEDKDTTIERLKDDKFFNRSPYLNYNIIRT